MPCYGPLTAYRPQNGAPDQRLVFRKDKSINGIPIKIPCGQCAGCKLEKSRQWAVRCLHEKRMHNASAFLTLTYNDASLPPGLTLRKRDLQLFMKKLRKDFGTGVRFFACGEYGEQTYRPHYHVLLLSHNFEDRKFFRNAGKYKTYVSPTLGKLWPQGNHYIGEVNFDSAAYVARYCMKKITGPKADDHYKGREPEFIVMSRRPGIGTGYFNKYKDELINHDNIIVNGVPAALPRFYDNKLPEILIGPNIGLYTKIELIKLKRRRRITLAQRRDNSLRRLRVKEVVALAKLKLKARTI